MATRIAASRLPALQRLQCRIHQARRSLVSSSNTLYENSEKSPTLFVFIGAISVVQMLFWSYLAWFAYRGLSDEGLQRRIEHSDDHQTKSKVITSTKWRLVASLLALSTGAFFAYTANMLTFRTVVRLQLVQRRSSLLFTTYTPWGRTRVVDVPLASIRSVGDRQGPSPQVAVKVKGYPLFFLLDKKGVFKEPRLFDALIVSRTSV